jgi:hypothetical protein
MTEDRGEGINRYSAVVETGTIFATEDWAFSAFEGGISRCGDIQD